MKYITPAYYETTLKYRDFRDEESEEMLDDYIFDNIVYDLGTLYDFGGVHSFSTPLCPPTALISFPSSTPRRAASKPQFKIALKASASDQNNKKTARVRGLFLALTLSL